MSTIKPKDPLLSEGPITLRTSDTVVKLSTTFWVPLKTVCMPLVGTVTLTVLSSSIIVIIMWSISFFRFRLLDIIDNINYCNFKEYYPFILTLKKSKLLYYLCYRLDTNDSLFMTLKSQI